MAKPLYYRSTNPGLAGVTARANKLYEWDGTGSMPTEIQNGKAFMPPAEISGETVIWSDTYTLGYTDEANAAPIFYSDGAAGDTKVLEMINHIAGRLDQALFADLVSAKAWISSVQGVDFVEAGAITVSNKVYDLYALENIVNDEWLPGMMNYISSSFAGQAWPSATNIPVNVIDENGVNRQAELLAATSIKIYHDASNYVEFDVTSAVVNTFNGSTGAPNYDSDPNIVNTVVVLSVANPVAVGVAPSVANPSVTLLINGENPASGGGSGSGTTVALNAGPLTFIIENNTGNETIRGIFAHTAGNYFGLEDSAVGVNKVDWMPLAAGESLTLTGLPIYENDRAALQTNFFNAANYTLNTFVNDVAAETMTLFTNGFSYATYRAGYQPVQPGDVVRFVYTKA